MDAPTTTSADNGTSGDSGGGGGWFTPRKPVPAKPAGPDAARPDGLPGPAAGGPAEDPDGSRERIAGQRRPLTSIRLVGASAARTSQSRPGAGTSTDPFAAPRPQAAAAGPAHPPVASLGPAEALTAGASPADPRTPEPRTAESRTAESRTAEPRPAEPVTSAPVAQEPPTVPWPDGSGAQQPAPEPPVAQQPAPEPFANRRPSAPQPAVDHRSASQPPVDHRPAPQPPVDHRSAPQPPVDHRSAAETPTSHPDTGDRAHEPRGVPDAVPAGQSGPEPAVESGSPDAIRIRRTLGEVAPVSDKVTSYFYALLFTRHPELRTLFPAAMEAQRDRLLKALLTAAEHMDNPEVLTDYLQHLGRGHRKYGTDASHYPAVGEALIGALSRYATTTWDEETEAAWVRTYTTISQIMIDAAAENERHAPAWWHAEVVSHDLRTPDIAVITVRPDQPYPFLAGQYTSLETPWWPRIWRHYSFASAPRSDGLLSFHVKAVPAGWVSNALVHHARPGDVLRLGPPAGSMTVDHSTDNGLLCLGGGTGIAPIKALVEDVAEHGARRPVEVFYGARTDHDLYDIDTMLRLQQVHPWLEVRAIIDGKTQLPDVVREYGPWNEYDAYLSGPPGMIRSGVDALRGVGMPYERIRHDSLEELVAAAD